MTYCNHGNTLLIKSKNCCLLWPLVLSRKVPNVNAAVRKHQTRFCQPIRRLISRLTTPGGVFLHVAGRPRKTTLSCHWTTVLRSRHSGRANPNMPRLLFIQNYQIYSIKTQPFCNTNYWQSILRKYKEYTLSAICQ